MTTPPDDQWPTRDDDATVVRREPVIQEIDEAGAAPVGPPPDEPGRRIGYGLLLGLLAVGLVAAGVLAYWLLKRDDNKKQTTTVVVTTAPTTAAAAQVAVPRVVGMKEQQALVRLGQVGLRPKEVYKPTKQAKGVVVSQKPQEAKQVARGSQVTMVIDSGAPKVAVPTVKGMTAAQATQKLDAVGLDSTQTEVTSTQPAGTVVDQAPAAGAKAAKGSSVTLSVAKAAPVAVPNVVGQTSANATSALQNAGFQVNTATVPGAPKGQVTAQSPTAGTKAKKGSPVRINVADGSGAATTTATTTATTAPTTTAKTTTGAKTTPTPAPQPTSATVPDLSGQTLQAAVQQLGQVGLLASIQYIPGTDPLGTIEQQSPAAGQTVKARSHITINASSGPGQKTQKSVPDATGQTLQQAVQTMNGAGLRLIYAKLPVTDRTQAGKVVEQSPLAGKQAPQNAQVVVYIGAFKSG